ncbi:MAG: hypothetical protein ACI31A_03380 [Candidatus Limisoma sp.]
MTTKVLLSTALLACALFVIPFPVSALSTSGEWTATTITGDETVNLTGDVTVTGAISINSGGKLTINNYTGRTLRITPNATMPNVFRVNSGGKLVINGNASGSSSINYNGIVINGGASLTWNNYNLDGTSGYIQRAIHASGDFDIKNVTIENIYRSDVGGDGAGNSILFDGGSSGRISHCEFKYLRGMAGSAVLCDNKNTNGSTLDIVDSHFIYCGTNGSYGSVIRSYGGSTTILTMTNSVMEYCYSTCHGGAIYWNAHGGAACCKFDGCRFLNNKAERMGGALFIETSVSFINNKTIIQGNTAEGKDSSGEGGGGVCINGYTAGGGNSFTELVAVVSDKLEIIGNSAPNGFGGGFYCRFEAGTQAANNATITYYIEGAAIKNNTAKNGGGTYFRDKIPASKNVDFTVNLNYGDVTGNTAYNDGGGIYLDGLNIGNNSTGGKICYVSGNAATNGGGIFINNGNLALDKVDISGNTSTNNGGGVCLEGGSFKINSGTISNNRCNKYGGGVYSSNSGGNYINSSFSGGTVNANAALAGGGICVDGNIDFTTTSTSIERNNATNGGGICVVNGAKMTYKSGLIRFNAANAAATITGETAYQKNATEVAGFGGGVFVADNSSLKLDISDGKLGFYGNKATNGADDIFANGKGTSVTVPDVKTMTLTDFAVPVPASSLFWAEDYSTNDTNYGNGTKINTAWSGTNLRYQVALNDRKDIYQVQATDNANQYISLALGYGNIFITLRKTGLRKGDSAIFNITKEGETKPYMTVLLTGIDDVGSAVERSISLFAGTWTVKETNWSWAYRSAVTERTQSFTKQSDEGTLFVFDNTPKDGVPPHGEAIKQNSF